MLESADQHDCYRNLEFEFDNNGSNYILYLWEGRETINLPLATVAESTYNKYFLSMCISRKGLEQS